MPDKRWKDHERYVATRLGTVRYLRQGTDSPDARIPGWSIEVKTRLKFPAWLMDFMRQALANAIADDHAAVVLCEARRGVKTKRYALLDFEVFADLIAPTPELKEALTEVVAEAQNETA